MTHAPTARRCVVAVMAKQPAAGRTKTRLSPPLSPQGAAQLYEALLTDTITLVSGLRDVCLAVAVTSAAPHGGWAPPAPPDAIVLNVSGRDIGECLQQTTERLCTAGFRRVIALNSDGPTLPPANILQADALLARHDVVLGPNEDGGYYLVGLRRPHPDLFRDVEWSTPRVLTQTLTRAAALGLSVALVAKWYDVDTAADLERLCVDLARLPAAALPCTRGFFAGWARAINEWQSRMLGDGGSCHEEIGE